MKQLLKILKFEYMSCVKNKAFIIITVTLMVAVILIVFIPSLFSNNSSTDGEEG